MSTETDTRIDVDVDLNIEPWCEWSDHSEFKHSHDDGPARWRMFNRCPECGMGSVKLSCDKRATKFRGYCRCTAEGCDYVGLATTFIVKIEPI